jgi:hypothetical protein
MSQRCAQTQEIEVTGAEKQPHYWPSVVLKATRRNINDFETLFCLHFRERQPDSEKKTYHFKITDL